MVKKTKGDVKKAKVVVVPPEVDPHQPDKERGPCCTSENPCRCSGE